LKVLHPNQVAVEDAATPDRHLGQKANLPPRFPSELSFQLAGISPPALRSSLTLNFQWATKKIPLSLLGLQDLALRKLVRTFSATNLAAANGLPGRRHWASLSEFVAEQQ